MQAGDDPVLVWGQPAAHFCLGQHQSIAAELIAEVDVPVIRRPLGGGGVWLDRNQVCLVLVAPRDFFPQRPQDWYAHTLAPMLQVYAEMGWQASLVGQDVSLNGKKLAGTGAASIGVAGLVGTSFLLKFPIDEFTRLIAVPSDGYRVWLADALRLRVTTWSDHAELPELAWLSLVYRRAAAGIFDWRWEQALLREDERAAREDCRAELIPEADKASKLIPYGIKINALSFLTERDFESGWVRVCTDGKAIARVALSAIAGLPEYALQEVTPTQAAISDKLSQFVAGNDAQLWAQRILMTAYFAEE
ncbi:MAG: hypothetical protein ABL868_11155 [Sulfuriferula sp.]